MDMFTEGMIIYENKSEDSWIVVKRREYLGDEILELDVNGSMETMMYVEKEKQDELIFPYMSLFSYAFAARPQLESTYLIGGGGFAYPRHYLARYPEKRIHVAEYSQDIVDVSTKYFGLNTLLDHPNFTLSVSDGFLALSESDEMYDVIINDAFIGRKSIGRGSKDTKVIENHLNDDGIYMVNFIGAPKGWKSMGLKKYLKQLRKYFKYATVVVCEEDRSPYESQNLLLLASNQELL